MDARGGADEEESAEEVVPAVFVQSTHGGGAVQLCKPIRDVLCDGVPGWVRPGVGAPRGAPYEVVPLHPGHLLLHFQGRIDARHRYGQGHRHMGHRDGGTAGLLPRHGLRPSPLLLERRRILLGLRLGGDLPGHLEGAEEQGAQVRQDGAVPPGPYYGGGVYPGNGTRARPPRHGVPRRLLQHPRRPRLFRPTLLAPRRYESTESCARHTGHEQVVHIIV
mmetsp:Transcript_24383/g.68377  ORF Transcript_24383/g.68377 Transcript_24383/m.68377 type:complete len:220 (+) Transcript_24383:304-963(+)